MEIDIHFSAVGYAAIAIWVLMALAGGTLIVQGTLRQDALIKGVLQCSLAVPLMLILGWVVAKVAFMIEASFAKSALHRFLPRR